MKTDPCPCCGGSGKRVNQAALGNELRLARKGHGMTMTDMARRLKISAPYLCDLEHGKRDWPVNLERNYRAICNE